MNKLIATFTVIVLILLPSCADVQSGTADGVTSAETTSAQVTTTVTTTPAVTTITKPGDLPPVDSLPKADQSSVGKNVALSLKDAHFYYYFDTDSGKERLIVVDLLSTKADGGILYIYETNLKGLGGLCDAISSSVQAKVLAVSTISFYEFQYASWGLEFVDLADQGEVQKAELISLNASVTNPNPVQCYFSIVDADQGEVVMLSGNMTAQDSEYLTKAFAVMDRIIYRFDLAKYL